jgi:hypothetical protein
VKTKINKMEFKIGQIFVTKKGKKMEITEVYNGSVEVKRYVHRDSQNCKSYGWGHNTMSFKGCEITGGKFGLIARIQKEGWKLQLEKKKISATITK